MGEMFDKSEDTFSYELLLRRRFWAEINLDSAKDNFLKIRKSIKKNAKLCCVIKANAYGHGAEVLAMMYQQLGADFFAVSNIVEAMQLREAGITKPVLILGYTPPECVKTLAEMNISQALYSFDYAEELRKNAKELGVKIKIHLKLDTGMGRIGFDCKTLLKSKTEIDKLAKICMYPEFIREGIFSHFASADEGEGGDDYTNSQFERFISVSDLLKERKVDFDIRHISNSAGILDYKKFNLQMVRAGISLYGLSPSGDVRNKVEFTPIMSLKSVISMIKTVHAGDSISYGRKFKADREMKIATVPVGYADGFRRNNSNGEFCLLVNGQKAKILGRVCMDQLMIDVTDIPAVKMGDIVTVMGNDGEYSITADDLAKLNNTINYEIICEVCARVPRIYIKNNKVICIKDMIVENDKSLIYFGR